MDSSIQEILKDRIEAYKNNTLERKIVLDGKEYQKKWAEAVQFFQIQINRDRIKERRNELPFMAIRQKLIALRDLEDMRWFYVQCLKYSKKRKENSFSKCFFGALKLK